MFQNVQSLTMFENVRGSSRMFENVRGSSRMFENVLEALFELILFQSYPLACSLHSHQKITKMVCIYTGMGLHCHDGKADCSDVLYIFSVRMSVYHVVYQHPQAVRVHFNSNQQKFQFPSKANLIGGIIGSSTIQLHHVVFLVATSQFPLVSQLCKLGETSFFLQ